MNFTNQKSPWSGDATCWTFIGANRSRKEDLNKVTGFITHPTQKMLLLSGHYGIGKSSVVSYCVYQNHRQLYYTDDFDSLTKDLVSGSILELPILFHIPVHNGFPDTYLIPYICQNPSVKIVVEVYEPDSYPNLNNRTDFSDRPSSQARRSRPTILTQRPDVKVQVKKFEDDDIKEMVDGALEKYALSNDKKIEISQEVVKWVGYHPLLVQILCHFLSDDWESYSSLPSDEAIKQIVDFHEQSFKGELKKLWDLRAEIIQKNIDQLGTRTPVIALQDVLWQDSSGRYQLIKLLEPFLRTPINETQMDRFIVKIDGTNSTGFLVKEGGQWFVVTCAHCIPNNARTIGSTVQISVRGGVHPIAGTVSFFGANANTKQETWILADDIALLTISNAQIAELKMTYSTPPNIAAQHLTNVISSRIWARGYSNPVVARTIQIEREQLIDRGDLYELTTAEIQKGDSGSPLWITLDSEITIIGMIGAKWTPNGTPNARWEIPIAEQHRAYACSVSDIRRAINTVLRESSE